MARFSISVVSQQIENAELSKVRMMQRIFHESEMMLSEVGIDK